MENRTCELGGAAPDRPLRGKAWQKESGAAAMLVERGTEFTRKECFFLSGLHHEGDQGNPQRQESPVSPNPKDRSGGREQHARIDGVANACIGSAANQPMPLAQGD